MNAQHTPGPWLVHGDHRTMIGAPDRRQMLAEALHSHVVKEWERTLEEAQANATLIAAAPDMLRELRALAHLAGTLNARQHAGLEITPAMWSMLHQLTNSSNGVIEKATS